MKDNTSMKRLIGVAVGVIIIVAGFIFSGYIANQKEEPPKQQRSSAVRQVALRSVVPDAYQVDIQLQGRLVAFERAPIIAEVTGVFEASAHPFKQGVFYRKGQLLARINNTEARYALLAQKSALANSLAQAMPDLKIDYPATFPAWDAYLRAFDPEQPLPDLPPVADDAAKFYLNAKNIYGQYYQIKGAEERLAKYELRAPFSGTLTEASATVGSLVRSNQPLGTLTANSYEMAATVPVADLQYLDPGSKATLYGPSGEAYAATVSRVSTQVDPTTQSATVFLNVRGDNLREGLYLRGVVKGSQVNDVIPVDQRYLIGQNELYIVRDSLLERAEVDIVRRSDTQVYVRGLAPGTQILDEALPGAFAGMKVKEK